jgi:hypothetical protein
MSDVLGQFILGISRLGVDGTSTDNAIAPAAVTAVPTYGADTPIGTGTYYEVPLSPNPQRFVLPLGGTNYTFTFIYRGTPDAEDSSWYLDVGDEDNAPIACGIPLITGADLFGQLGYLGFGGSLVVTTEGAPYAVPTFENLGITSHVYFVVGATQSSSAAVRPAALRIMRDDQGNILFDSSGNLMYST